MPISEIAAKFQATTQLVGGKFQAATHLVGGAAVVTAPWWVDLLEGVSLIAKSVGFVAGAILSVNAVYMLWRGSRRKNRRRTDRVKTH